MSPALGDYKRSVILEPKTAPEICLLLTTAAVYSLTHNSRAFGYQLKLFIRQIKIGLTQEAFNKLLQSQQSLCMSPSNLFYFMNSHPES